MMKKTFYRTVSVFLSALLLTSAGCSKNGNPNQSSKSENGKSNALDISFDYSYKGEKLDIDSQIQYFNNVTELNNGILFSGYDKIGNSEIFLYHLDNGTSEPLNLAYPSSLDKGTDYYILSNFIDSENHLAVIYHASLYDEKNKDEPYQDLGYTMEIYDENFKVIETKNMNDVLPSDNYFGFIASGQNGNYYIALNDNMTGDTKLCVFDKDFKPTGEISGDIQYIEHIFTNQNGKTIVLYEDKDWNNCYGILNPEEKTIEPIKIDGVPRWFNGVFEGKQGYDLFIYDSEFIYGINLETNTCDKVLNWANSDFMGDSVNNVFQMKDGRFFITEMDYSKDYSTSEIWILNERDPKELENVQLITLATLWTPTQLGKAVNQFNRTHTDCRIGIANYGNYSTEEDPDAGLTKFENDMTSGIVADIICMSDMPYERYANKGLLLDLSSYINELNPDEYFTNFFDSLRYGDKLYRIGFSYNIATLEAKTKHVGEKSGLSLSEFSSLIKNPPNGMQSFSEMTKDTALYSLCVSNQNSFIDLNTNTCNFNSPEFIQLLELCNSYPEEESNENWTDEQWEKYWADEAYQYINDKTLFYEANIYELKDYLNDRFLHFDKEATTLVGYPTTVSGSNGGKFEPNYTISISSNSAFKDQIWEFCKNMLSEEEQENLSWSMPVSKQAFDKIAEKAILPDFYTDENGKKIENPNYVYRGEEEIEVPAFTKADTDRVKSYIENIKESFYYDEKIYNIINEEAQKYFSGDQTSQKSAEMIQSRVTLYLSEQN